MKEEFFEGADFKSDFFKALMPRYYPKKYKTYIEQETELLKRKIKGSDRILEAGVGIGRLIPELAPLVKQFIGIDNADLMLKESKKIAKDFRNVKIMRLAFENVDEKFAKDHFDYSLCVWNTLGNVKNEKDVLRKLSKVTKKSIFVTVYKKGTIKDRENWYKTVGVKINKIDKDKEIFYSESGLKSKSYSMGDLEVIARKAGLKIKECKVFNDVIIWMELMK